MRGPTVLVLAEKDDRTADLVENAVHERGRDAVRVDTADYPASVWFTARPDDPCAAGYLMVRDRRIDLDSVRSVYRRHPARFTFPAAMSAPERRFATFETLHGLAGILAAQPWRWIDRPARVADASYKTHQLPVAARCGLRVPKTLVTDDPHQARRFASDVGDIVYKTLSAGLVTDSDELKLIYTTRITVDDLAEMADRQCLHLFQQWIPKEDGCSAHGAAGWPHPALGRRRGRVPALADAGQATPGPVRRVGGGPCRAAVRVVRRPR